MPPADHAPVIADLIFLLSIAGLADALYFTFAYYGRVRKLKWIPAVLCARDGSSCVTVVKTPYARVFGVPNSLLGIVYYVVLMYWAESGMPVGFEATVGEKYHVIRVGWLLFSAGGLTVVMGFYLVYALKRKLNVDCPLCYAAHAINVVLFVLLILGLKG
jgi:uncharacterized membrane protein